MQTNFNIAQLANPDIEHAEKILRSCVHCGFCLATCPTYQIKGDERDSPRGRIYIIKDVLENNKKPDKTAVRHIDRCLSCLSCMTTCPSGVDYMHLVDHARYRIEESSFRIWHDRLLRKLLSYVLVRPQLMRLALHLGKYPIHIFSLMPGKLGAIGRLGKVKIPNQSKFSKPQTFLPKGKRIARVALLAGCVQQVVGPQINESAVRLLTKMGCEVTVIDGFGCCGALPRHMGKREEASSLARRNLIALSIEEKKNGNFDSFIVTTSGCGTTLKDYEKVLASEPDLNRDSRRFASLVADISEFIHKYDTTIPEPISKNIRVAYHPACSLQHGQKVVEAPKELLKKAGYKVLNIPDSHICCGSAGTYNLLQPEIATELQIQKAVNINSIKPDIVATGNLGCILQINQSVEVPVLHIVELLDWASGGPKPEILN